MASRYPSLEEMAKAFGGPVQGWSPELWDTSGSGSEGQTYGSTNEGYFIRVGNLVFVWGRLTVTALGTLTASDTASLGNLPHNAIGTMPLNVSYTNDLALPSASSLVLQTQNASKRAYFRLFNSTSTVSTITIAQFSSTGSVAFSGFYITDDAL